MCATAIIRIAISIRVAPLLLLYDFFESVTNSLVALSDFEIFDESVDSIMLAILYGVYRMEPTIGSDMFKAGRKKQIMQSKMNILRNDASPEVSFISLIMGVNVGLLSFSSIILTGGISSTLFGFRI